MAKIKWKDYIEETKKLKDKELNLACQSAILSGFDFSINGIQYHFSYDLEAQSNIQELLTMYNAGINVDGKLTATDPNGNKVRVSIDKTTLDQLVVVAYNHKEEQLRKYREVLLPLVVQATSVKEIQSISWN